MMKKEDMQWADLTIYEIEKIEDVEKKQHYRSEYRRCLTQIINPLLSTINNKDFKISTQPLTCRNMLKDLMNYYDGYSREEIVELISNSRKKN